MNTFSQLLHTLLGIGTEPRDLTFLQVSVRGVIVFIATLIMMRLGSKRSLAEKTAFDAVFVVIIGSMLARAINGSEAFFPTLGTGFVLVLLHRLFGVAAYYSHFFGFLIKGEPVVLVRVLDADARVRVVRRGRLARRVYRGAHRSSFCPGPRSLERSVTRLWREAIPAPGEEDEPARSPVGGPESRLH